MSNNRAVANKCLSIALQYKLIKEKSLQSLTSNKIGSLKSVKGLKTQLEPDTIYYDDQ